MTNALFHSNRGNSSLIMVKQHKLQIGRSPVYVNKEACEGMKKNDVVQMPDDYKIVPMSNKEGNFTTKDGTAVLKTLGF